jgi:predicted phosphodiesterase
MRLGVVADIHGNLPALEAVLDELRDEHTVDDIVCLGDIVGVLGWPRECVQQVREECTATVIGNHDRAVLPQMDVRAALEHGVTEMEYSFVREQLQTADDEWLWTLPETATVPVDAPPSEQAVLVHSHPDPDIRWSGDDHVTVDMFADVAAHADVGTLLLGHLHTQHAVTADRNDTASLVVNPGSVGQPRDGPAEYAVVDTVAQTAELRQVEYPTDTVAQRLRDVGIAD